MKKILCFMGQFQLMITLILFISNTAFAAEFDTPKEWERVLDLRGQWKFELGDNLNWMHPEFDDSGWEKIFVPSPWENEGFPGYDGYAWYRYHFAFNPDLDRKNLYLRLGFIDDVDETYLNGHLLGYKGIFPPGGSTGYHIERIYYLPPEYLNKTGDNVIAVRVYDSYQAGGIAKGVVGIYRKNSFLLPDFDLSGTWKFKAGDDPGWEAETYDDTDWKEVFVPALWDAYGLKEYDGHGWFRKQFILPQNLKEERLILLLGKIDDLDEVFINGKKIGQTGKIYHDPDRIRIDDDAYQKDRAYAIPPGYLNMNGVNRIAVRVYDGMFHGGIYEGPIGIVTRRHYMEWEREFDRGTELKDFFLRLFQN